VYRAANLYKKSMLIQQYDILKTLVVMIKMPFFLILMILSGNNVFGQLSATAAASTSVIIITPVGTENSGNIIQGSFYSGKSSGIVELNNNIIGIENRSGLTGQAEKTAMPSFHVLCGQSSYAITFSFDPQIINRNAGQETMRIESLSIIPVNKNKPEPSGSDRFSIGTKLIVSPSQVPGYYSSPNPCAVTIHFN
jgi:Domain of unknown function (DUF4402)